MTMPTLDKKSLSERDLCSKFITPALVSAKWDLMNQIREEVSFTKGRVIVRGQLSTRGEPKRAEYQKAQAAVAEVREKLRRELQAALESRT